MAASSRLVKYERRQALRSALLYIVLTAAILFGLTRFGTQIVTSVTGLITSTKDVQQQSNSSLVAPAQINSLPEITNQKIITIQGAAPSGLTVRLTLNGQKQDIVSNAQGVWATAFSLNEGENNMKAQVVDLQGNTSQEVSAVVTLDTTAPTLSISAPEDNSIKNGKKEQSVSIEGTTDQDSTVRINDRIAIVSGNGQFSIQFTLNDGDNEFTVIATDRAGNTTQDQRHITYNP